MRLLLALALLNCVFGQANDNDNNTAGNATRCEDLRNQTGCVAFGKGNSSSTVYGACVWCGDSATDGQCRSPPWAGNFSCPVATGSLWNYGCLPGDTVAACGSHCINVCDTDCRDYRAPIYTLTLYSDANCTLVSTQPQNLTRACVPLSNGASVGMVSFDNNGFTEQNYLCNDCGSCDATCTDNRTYCACNKVAGLSNLYYVVRPAGNNVCQNGTLSSNFTSTQSSGPRNPGTARSAAIAPVHVPIMTTISKKRRYAQ